jgi:hypothetical protein
MAAHAQTAPIEQPMSRQKLLSKLDRTDLPERTKRSLELSLGSLFDGYDDDQNDPNRIEPNPRSFGRLLEFLSHPYHRMWAPPAIALNGQGMFVAVWQEPDVFRWLLEFQPNGDIDETYLALDADGGIADIPRKSRRVGESIWPPVAEAKLR